MGIRCIDRTKILTLLILITTPVVIISLLNSMGITNAIVESTSMSGSHKTTTSEEYLLIKIVLHPALAKYMKSRSSCEECKDWCVYNISGFIIIKRHSLDQVTLIVGNKTLGEFKLDELKGVTRNITTTIYDYPVTVLITVRSINASLFSPEFPQEAAHLKDKVLEILEKSAFIKLLKSLGIRYYIKNVIPSRRFSWSEPSTLIIDGATVTMDIVSEKYTLRTLCSVKLKTPCKLYISGIPKDFTMFYPPEERDKLLVIFIEGGGGVKIISTGLIPLTSTWRRLNITKEFKEKVMEIITKNRITAELLKSGAEVERIVASERKSPEGWKRYITVTLTWPERPELKVEIDIIDDTIRRIEADIQEP